MSRNFGQDQPDPNQMPAEFSDTEMDVELETQEYPNAQYSIASVNDSDDNGYFANDDSDADSVASTITCGPDPPTNEPLPANMIHMQHFRKYLQRAGQHFMPLTNPEVNAIRLMDTLRKKKATLDTYDAIMRWHLETTGEVGEGQGLGAASTYISRDTLLAKLSDRYNVHPIAELERTKGTTKKPKLFLETPFVLPSSKASVDIIHFDAREQVVSLLTDPRFHDGDFLHFDNDPLAPPPNLNYLGDINTGTAYKETYKKLITDPSKQILVPIVMYIDGAATGQFVDLKVEALKMTLGIFKKETRERDCAWRVLGYVPNYRKETSRGKKIFVDSGHEATTRLTLNDDEGAEEKGKKRQGDDAPKAQDWQAILSLILESYRQLEQDGLVFDYRYGGKIYKNLEMKFFLIHLKTDTEEADKLCGKFLSRTRNVKQLCRYCCCPTQLTDNCVAEFPYKTETRIKRLCRQNNEEELREMSQHCIDLAFHDIRFGLHNNRGIHGACPIEMLHQILLGIFKYLNQEFFKQVGPT